MADQRCDRYLLQVGSNVGDVAVKIGSVSQFRISANRGSMRTLILGWLALFPTFGHALECGPVVQTQRINQLRESLKVADELASTIN